MLALVESDKATRLETSTSSEALRARAVSRALAKTAPFHRNNNSAADALIIEAALAFAKVDRHGQPFLLLTHNTDDFSDPKDTRKPHPDLAPEFTTHRIGYMTNAGAMLHEVQAGLIAPEVVERVERVMASNTPDEGACRSCGALARGHWRRSQYGGGLSWHMTCGSCGESRDTGEFYD